MPQFFPLTLYPFTAVASTTILADATGVTLDLSNSVPDLNRANVLLVQNTGTVPVYFNYDADNAEAPTGSGVFPDGDQAIAGGAIMTFPIAPSAGTGALFYTLTGSSTVLISRGWGS